MHRVPLAAEDAAVVTRDAADQAGVEVAGIERDREPFA